MDIVEQLTAPAYWISGSPDGHEGDNDAPRAAADEIERLRDELAASQARERSIMNGIADWLCQHEQKNISNAALHDWMRESLALPADDTALREMLVRAQEEMRERCAKVCDAQHDRARTSTGAARAYACAETIRALEVKP